MKLDKLLNVAIADNLPMQVCYKLGNKNLGEYVIKEQFPHTLLLHPTETCCRPIWIPNPRALDPKFIVNYWDDEVYTVSIYESDRDSLTHIWKLTFNIGDLLCLK